MSSFPWNDKPISVSPQHINKKKIQLDESHPLYNSNYPWEQNNVISMSPFYEKKWNEKEQICNIQPIKRHTEQIKQPKKKLEKFYVKSNELHPRYNSKHRAHGGIYFDSMNIKKSLSPDYSHRLNEYESICGIKNLENFHVGYNELHPKYNSKHRAHGGIYPEGMNIKKSLSPDYSHRLNEYERVCFPKGIQPQNGKKVKQNMMTDVNNSNQVKEPFYFGYDIYYKKDKKCPCNCDNGCKCPLNCKCQCHNKTKKELRKLFVEHAVWTKKFINVSLSSSPDTDAITTRLLQNQNDIGMNLSSIIGKNNAMKLANLLRIHILHAGDAIQAIVIGKDEIIKKSLVKLFKNSDQVAKLLTDLSPNKLPYDMTRTMFHDHNQYIIDMTNTRIKKKWKKDILLYDEYFSQLMKMADIIANALI